jgi:hypothetical protein
MNKLYNVYKYFKRILRAIFNKTKLDDLYIKEIESVRHLRDMFHNLPFHLNLKKEDESYLFEIFNDLDTILYRHSSIMILDFDYIEKNYIGVYAGHAVSSKITEDDIKNAREYKSSALLKIAKAILFSNLDRYQRKSEWFKPLKEEVIETSLGFKAIYSNIDLMSEIKPEDQDMADAILSYSYFDDNSMTYLLEKYKERNIKVLIKIYLVNQKRTSEVEVSKKLLEKLNLK